jgi:hypothetical protein
MSKVISDVKSASHPVAASHPVNVRAIIGNAQKGAWVMLLDEAHVGGGTDSGWVTLGNGDALKGKLLEVSAVIQDVRPQTDRLSLIVEVDGPTTTTVQIAHIGDPGDSAAYSVIVFFV